MISIVKNILWSSIMDQAINITLILPNAMVKIIKHTKVKGDVSLITNQSQLYTSGFLALI